MILFNLDMKGIAVSWGSACQSGQASHVLSEMLSDEDLRDQVYVFLSHNSERRYRCTDGCFKKYLNIKSVLLH
jgi:cysteine desulfurase